MRWRKVGLDGVCAIPSASRKNRSPRTFSKEPVATHVLDRAEVALALDEQTEVAANDVAVGNPASDRQGRIQASEHRCDSVEIVTHQGQAGGGGEVIAELLDRDRAHAEIVGESSAIRHWISSPSGCCSTEVRLRIQEQHEGQPGEELGEPEEPGPVRTQRDETHDPIAMLSRHSPTSLRRPSLAACRTQDDSAATAGERSISRRFLLAYSRYARRNRQNLASLSHRFAIEHLSPTGC